MRLLNIDTPETVDPEVPTECLGPEASAYSASVLRAGTEVTLKYDGQTLDAYGRTLAAVVLKNGENVSELLAERGLGAAVSYGHQRFLASVRAASADASSNEAGLFDPKVVCTAPGAEATLNKQATSELVALRAGTSTQLLDRAAVRARKYLALIRRTDPATKTIWRLYSTSQRRTISASIDGLRLRSTRIIDAPSQRRAQVAAARAAAHAAAIKRAKLAAAKRLKAQAAVERAAAAAKKAAAKRAAERDSSADSSSSSTGGNPSHYTGCRKYAPGGKSWKPIPCP